jgi:hypothetical protein
MCEVRLSNRSTLQSKSGNRTSRWSARSKPLQPVWSHSYGWTDGCGIADHYFSVRNKRTQNSLGNTRKLPEAS